MIGRGGVGIVARAADPDCNRTLAVKVLLARHRDRPDLVRRFLEEAQVTSQLQHPGVTPVHEIGRLEDGRPFFAMKLVRGQTLAALLQQRSHPGEDLPRSLSIFGQVCQTVAYAHSRGVLHRDLKPANVMVGSFGEVQVMDWGFAKVLGQQPSEPAPPPEQWSTICTVRTAAGDVSAAGHLLGTLAFLAQEQALGDVGRLDERADVFGLGAILCVILTGQPPYRGATQEELLSQALRADLTDAFARLDSCGADSELVALAKACLAPVRDHRPRDAAAVAAAVAAYEAGVRERLRKAELDRAQAEVRAVEERKQRRLRRVLTVAVVVGLALFGGGALLWHQRDTERRQDVEAALDRAAELRDRARWSEAARALDHATQRLGDAGPNDLRDRLGRHQSDLELARRLDVIRLDKAALVNSRQFSYQEAEKNYERAFREAMLAEPGDAAAVVAERVSGSPIRAQLVAALDDWAATTDDRHRQEWLLEVARRADPDPHRDRFRDPKTWSDATALAKLAAEAPRAELSPQLLAALATRLEALGADAVPLLKAAQARHPADFWLTFQLAETLLPSKPAEAVGFFHLADVLRPNTAYVHTLLGSALEKKGELDESIAWHRKALALDERMAFAHSNLGVALDKKGQPEQAIACYNKALELDPRLFRAHYSLGAVYQSQGKLKEAVECYHKAIEVNPKYTIPYHNLGIALQALGRLDEAVTSLRKAIEFNPRDFRTHSVLTNVLREKGELDEAITVARKAVALAPTDAELHGDLGEVLALRGLGDEALASSERAVLLDPKLGRAHITLGICLSEKGDKDRALACLKRAVTLQPRSATAQHNLGIALAEREELDEAINCHRRAVDLEPNNASWRHGLGRALRQKSDLDKAVAQLEKAVLLAPESAAYQASLGDALVAQGKKEEGIGHLRRAVELDPKYTPGHGFLGDALVETGQVDEAIACYRKAVELEPKSPMTHRGLGRGLWQKGDRSGAIASWQAALALEPKDEGTLNNLGLAFEKGGQLEEAVACYKKALTVNPKAARTLFHLGGALYDLGQYDEALLHQQESVALAPDHGPSHDNLGLTLRRLGRYDEAIASHRKALAINPRDATTHHNLGLALSAAGMREEAITSLKQALELNPKDFESHAALGQLYFDGGRFAEATESTRQGLNLIPKGHPMRAGVERQLRQYEAWLILDGRLPTYLKGEARPQDAAERIKLAWLCQQPHKGLYHAAARFYAEAFAEQPKRASDMAKQHRYNASCAATLAAAGQGKDGQDLDDKERSRSRQQALDWLKADLAEWSRLAETGVPEVRPRVRKTLEHWLKDPDLSTIRDAAELAKLPEVEGQAWQQFWKDVEKLLAKARDAQ